MVEHREQLFRLPPSIQRWQSGASQAESELAERFIERCRARPLDVVGSCAVLASTSRRAMPKMAGAPINFETKPADKRRRRSWSSYICAATDRPDDSVPTSTVVSMLYAPAFRAGLGFREVARGNGDAGMIPADWISSRSIRRATCDCTSVPGRRFADFEAANEG